ncbi:MULTISPECIES: TIGR02302 family protein [unclassified Ruegeria]|uniref:TIGR02302 family protein n=1 Tax=unclassified Ruegeria TaxID=2625375 RepID=UPI0014910660|nr:MULTISPECIES: TIGR02302 family protein [unclassified Ruegeria]NOD89264.1 TIGR02302 family protein [Ruegeria sp. HKCCD4318]NOE13573.1 TIGR02302 family protein [Ruegeria sp. HKCCD4318-2]NOG07677.1 TIGR02302 family protein [Ruegeria sp. HKCCD4315]
MGMVAEQVLRAFWPLFSILMALLAALMLGLQDQFAVEVVWGAGALSLIAIVLAGVWGLRRVSLPSRADALMRLDETLPGRPIQALMDDQAIGSTDQDSVALWQAHKHRMAQRAATAAPAKPDLRLASRDPYALRYAALLAFVVAVLFGSLWRVGSVADMAPGTANAGQGPTWEGWVEPPRYTGLPTLYLADQADTELSVPKGSRITLRMYGEVGAHSLTENSSTLGTEAAIDPEQEFVAERSGQMRIDGPAGREWAVQVIDDATPKIAVAGSAKAEAGGQMKLPYVASDDYGVVSGSARIELDLAAVDRRHGLTIKPEPREVIEIELPMPITGDRADFSEDLIEDFSQHPWAHLPVKITLMAVDAADQQSTSEPFMTALPARRFFDPLAAAVIEQRRDLLWSRSNAPRVAQLLRAVSHLPEDLFRSDTAYLRLRVALRRLEAFQTYGALNPEQQEEIAQALWELAVLIEDGTLADALERMRRAQERLTEAMQNGASDEEIAELMQELREATQDYLQQLQRLAQQNGQEGENQPGQSGESLQMTQDDLQRMMDRIQELMEQGRMAEAQQALEEFQQMMENMRVTQGQGQGQQSEGQQAMEGLAETLREQQGLSDQAFRDLQEQFNPGAQSGESQGNEGRNGGLGRGQSHEGQGGQGQGSDQAGEGEQGQGSLADRQQALRNELNRQQQNLPGAGTPEGDAARDALGRAGRAMDEAEQALRGDDLAEAIDRQSEAMEALREGMRSLGEAMAQNQQNQPGQGTQEGEAQANNRDPLGRNPGAGGSISTDENLLQGEDVYRRARELLDEIRRRTGETDRPEIELEYLKRLLERF